MKYEDIENANKQIRTMTIERTNKKTGKITKKEYAEVNQRVKAFRMLYPNGCITTEILNDLDEVVHDGIVVVRTSAYDGDGKLLGTGLAIEEKSSSTLNTLNYIENAETSSCGRCLGFLGLGIDTAIASAEEMKSVEQQELKRNLDLLVQIRKLMAQKKLTPDVVYNEFNKKSDEMSEEELQEVIVWLESK